MPSAPLTWESATSTRRAASWAAPFSLGDFAIVVAATVGAPDTVSVAFNVNFMSAPKGGRLIATADEDKRGRTLGFYDCLIEDDLGTPVARMTGTVMHVGRR